jgi:hypothetical protein
MSMTHPLLDGRSVQKHRCSVEGEREREREREGERERGRE